jgi:hypothetical protein
MPIAVLVLAVVAYAFVMVAYPEYRTIGLAVGGAIVAALGVYFWLSDPETTRSAARIAPEEVVLDDLAFERTLRGGRLTGRVVNRSPDQRLRELTIALRLHDCPEETTPLEDCVVIGESSAIARPDAPPGQVRALSATYIFASLPEPEGALRWEWTLTDIRATP